MITEFTVSVRTSDYSITSVSNYSKAVWSFQNLTSPIDSPWSGLTPRQLSDITFDLKGQNFTSLNFFKWQHELKFGTLEPSAK